jgi:SAM-dependent methyltransferase
MKFIHTSENYNTESAEEVVPLLLDLICPKSVVDVGCGIGTWLSIFKKYGVEEVVGIDGEYVNRDLLFSHIEKNEFIGHNLTKPINLGKKFDLVLSLEVAEHLPEEVSDIFIDSLTQLGDCILFSAAIPGQGGDGHINEQWPTYWKAKFNLVEFELHDCIRSKIWSNEKVNWWYKQNIFLAINRNAKFSFGNELSIQNIVHPEHYVQKLKNLKNLEDNLGNLYQGKTNIKFIVNLLFKAIRCKINL